MVMLALAAAAALACLAGRASGATCALRMKNHEAEETARLRAGHETYAVAAAAAAAPPPSAAGDAAGGGSSSNEGSNPLVQMVYHMGPVLTADIRVYIIWYGAWSASQKRIIRDFFASVSSTTAPAPAVSGWWSTVRLYTDLTGRNITGSVSVAGEHDDAACSAGTTLTRIQVNNIIKSALQGSPDGGGTLPVDSTGGGVYFVFTAPSVQMQDFCRAVCGFHYFTFASVVGYTLPYAWVGNAATQCPGWCAYPFAVPPFLDGVVKPLAPPNGNVGVDGMVNVVGHELAEMASDPFVSGWWAGDDSRAPNEVADLCEGVYGPGGGGSFPGQLERTRAGATYNLNGVKGRKFLVQWLWNPVLQACYGPNAKVNS